MVKSEPVPPTMGDDEGEPSPKTLVAKTFHDYVFNETRYTLVLFRSDITEGDSSELRRIVVSDPGAIRGRWRVIKASKTKRISLFQDEVFSPVADCYSRDPLVEVGRMNADWNELAESA